MRRQVVVVVLATCAAILPAAAASAAVIPIADTITPGDVGACTPPSVGGPQVRWQMQRRDRALQWRPPEHRGRRVLVRGAFNMRSGVTRTGEREMFTGCADVRCGTLEGAGTSRSRRSRRPFEVLGAHGQARITDGTGELAGAKGAFAIACEPMALCMYRGRLHQ